VKTTTPQPYKAHLTPHLDMQRDLKFGGAWFEVCIDCDEPDDPSTVTHPSRYRVEGIKLGGVWWGAEDVLSTYMRECLDEVLQFRIAQEYIASATP
jgi:hypothetical protein